MTSASQSSITMEAHDVDMNPRAINVGKFAAARGDEINTMVRSISAMGSVQRTFQKLPRHMQRRAMSHNIKRMPRRLREIARIEAEKNKQYKPKQDGACPTKKSRRHRRRPGNLREAYAKRQMKNQWLETHIWHAKRFKMVEQWGWKIPLHPSDKSARAAYRATARHCVLSDISYNQVIEVKGSEVNILSAMKHLTSPQVGLTMASKAFLHGTRHREVLLYRRDAYPHGVLGPVDYLWRCPLPDIQQEGKDDAEPREERSLWMWVHPSCWSSVLSEMKAVCLEYNVSVESLEGELLRFRLQGPLAHPILLDALQVAMVTPHDDASEDGQEGESVASYWWDEYYKDTNHLKAYHQQAETWTALKGLQSSSEVSTKAVVSLVVRDPRVVLPKKRDKVMVNPYNLPDEPSNELAHKLPHLTSISPLWSSTVRDAVAEEQRPHHEINHLRSKLLVPGTDLNLGRAESRIPVMLLHQPGTRFSEGNNGHESTGMLGYGGGWDLILPRKWGMPFWIGLIYRGARACGLREAGKVALHRSMPRFPYDYPDSEAGWDIAKSIADELEGMYLKKPPAKRPHHARLGIAAPFLPPWSKLVREWVGKETGDHISGPDDGESVCGNAEDWYVLRNREKLEMLRTVMQDWSKKERQGNRRKHGKRCKIVETSSTASSNTTLEGKELPSHHPMLEPLIKTLVPFENRSLVWVGLCMVSRGVPSQFAIICIPTAEDLAELQQNPSYGGPKEPVHREFRLTRKRKSEKGHKALKSKKSKVNMDRPEPPSTPGDFGYVGASKADPLTKSLEKESLTSDANINTVASLVTIEAAHQSDNQQKGVLAQEKQAEASMPRCITEGLGMVSDSTSKLAKDSTDHIVDTTSTLGATIGTVSAEPMDIGTSNTTTPRSADAPNTTTGNGHPETDTSKSHDKSKSGGTSKSPDTCQSFPFPELLKSCTRSIMGFVTNGGQSFSCGKGMGVGFCTTLGLLNFLRASPRDQKLVVLVRDVQSLQYRFAYIYVPSL